MTKALEIANAVAFVARMRVRSARRPSDRSKALGAEEAALQIVKEIAALAAQADATAIQPQRATNREDVAAILYVKRFPHRTWLTASLEETKLAYEQADAILTLTRPECGDGK